MNEEKNQTESLVEVPSQYKVPFGEAVRRFLTRLTSKGRASRSEFWWAQLFTFVMANILTFVFGEGLPIEKVFWVFQVFLGWRRMQDVGKSGWWYLVPIYNLWLLTRPSEPRENKFGPVPNITPVSENKFWRIGALVACGISALFFIIDCCVDDEPDVKETVEAWIQSVSEKDVNGFLATTYFGDGELGDVNKNKDILVKAAEILLKDFGAKGFLDDCKVVEVEEEASKAYVRIAPRDENKNSQWLREGIVSMQFDVVKTESGWRVCVDQMRPILASAEQVNAAKSKADNEAVIDKRKRVMEGVYMAEMKGRNLFCAIVRANTEREACGLQCVWPTTEDNTSDEADDISGKIFRTSVEYFRELFDYVNMDKGDWNPYVTGVDVDCLELSDDNNGAFRNVGWMVMSGITEEMPDSMPVLISGNIGASYLTFGKGVKNFARDSRVIKIGTASNCWKPRAAWRDEYIVVIRKGGMADVIPAKECTLKRIFGSDSINIDADQGIRCLPLE